jgi:hypothetical protein
MVGPTLAAFDEHTGTPQWRLQLDAPPTPLATGPEKVVFGTTAGHLCAVRLADGDFDWCFRMAPVPPAGAALVIGDLVYFALLDNTLRAFHVSGGTLARLERLPSRPASGPVAAGTFVAVPLTTSAFALFTREQGAPRGVVPATEPPESRHQAAVVSPDGAWLVSLSIDVTGRRSLVGYGPAAPKDGTPSAK